MRRYFFTALIILISSLAIPVATQAVRYAQCDACGLCKDTTKSSLSESYYIQPATWQRCFECLYPNLVFTPTPTGSIPLAVPCAADVSQKTPLIYNIEGTPVPNNQQRCDTILMAPYATDQTNAPTMAPQSGRMFSDLGCISVNTAGRTFSDPNASVDVIQILLNLVISATGAVGTILVIAAATRLILSKGDPEKIREGKKTLTNVVLGLLFALFGLFIFRFFAAQVLRIPGFN